MTARPSRRHCIAAVLFLLLGALASFGAAWGLSRLARHDDDDRFLQPSAHRIPAAAPAEATWTMLEIWDGPGYRIRQWEGYIGTRDHLVAFRESSYGVPLACLVTNTRFESNRPNANWQRADYGEPNAWMIRPTALAVDAIAFAPVIWLVLVVPVALYRAVRSASRRRRGLCPACGYAMAALTQCPECGKQTARSPEPNERARASRIRPQRPTGRQASDPI